METKELKLEEGTTLVKMCKEYAIVNSGSDVFPFYQVLTLPTGKQYCATDELVQAETIVELLELHSKPMNTPPVVSDNALVEALRDLISKSIEFSNCIDDNSLIELQISIARAQQALSKERSEK